MSDPAPPAVPPRRRVPLVVIVGIVTVLLGGGLGFAAAYFLGVYDPSPAAGAEEEVAAEEGATEGGEHGEPAKEGEGAKKVSPDGSVVTSLGTFTVNLRGSGGGRVLRLEVQVEGKGKEAEEITARLAQVRDAIITAASDYTWPELEGTDGKTRLRDELLARVNGAVAPAVIEHIYFTQFVVQ